MIASDKNSLNNCTFTHITLKLHSKKTLWPLFMDTVQLCQGYRATARRQFTFYHPLTDWLIHHTLHECSTTAQTFLKCNW